MSKAIIIVHKCIQDDQEYGSNNEFMISRVFFTISKNNNTSDEHFAIVKQTAGSDYETAPLEVYLPPNKKLNFNYEQFRVGIERYYREIIDQGNSEIIILGAGNVRMTNITYHYARQFEVDIIDMANTGW